MSELAKRWAVAAVGVPLVLGALYVGGWLLAIPLAALAALGARELSRLAAARGVRPFEWLGMGVAAALVLVAVWQPRLADVAPLALAVVTLGLAAGLIGAVFTRPPGEAPLGSVAVTCFSALYLGVPLACVPLLRALPAQGGWSGSTPAAWGGVFVVALPLASAWIGDAAAYFAGRAWGRAKLAPHISPNKTWVGSWAGLAASGLAAGIWWSLARLHLQEMPFGPAAAVLAGAALGVAAQVGDLAESLLKREAGVKDSGQLFPGHGGVLDRLDALVLTLPLAYGFLLLAEVRP